MNFALFSVMASDLWLILSLNPLFSSGVFMNKIYRVVWNAATQTFTAVNEYATAIGRSRRSGVVGGTANIFNFGMRFSLSAIALGMLLANNQVMAAGISNGSALNSIAIYTGTSASGSGVESSGMKSIAVGGGGTKATQNESIAIGQESEATGDQSVALGANTRATGNSSIAIGGDDLDRVASTNPPAWNQTGNNAILNNTTHAAKFRTMTGDYLVDFTTIGSGSTRYANTKAGHGAVAVGVSANAGDLATAFGTKAKANGTASLALGVGAKTSRDNAIAIGAASNTDIAAANVGTATVNGVSYSGFAGDGSIDAGDQVSFGSVGYERQLKNVAAGQISAASTDAINGSQLYVIANQLQAGQTHYYSVKSNNTGAGSNYQNDGATGSDALAAGVKSSATAMQATAVGSEATATGAQSLAVGNKVVANGVGATAIGNNSEATVAGAQAFGQSSRATGINSAAIGRLATASGERASAFGVDNTASGKSSFAGGDKSEAATENSIAIGNEAKATTNTGTIAIGKSSEATGTSSVALGTSSKSTAQSTVAVGNNAKSQNQNAVAIGDSAQAAGTGNVAIGQAAGRLQAGATTGNNTVVVGVLAGADSSSNQGQVALGWEAGRNSTGAFNVASGYQAGQYINGTSNIAIGNKAGQGVSGTPVSANNSIALGSSSVVKSNDTIAIGTQATATNKESIAIGKNADTGTSVNSNATGLNVAIGTNAKIDSAKKTSWEATAVGADTLVQGVRTTAVGYGAQATEYYATAIGYKSTAPEWHALAVGSEAKVLPVATSDIATAQAITSNLTNVSDASKSATAIAVGRTATAAGYGAIAQGLNANATTAYATAFGPNARATKVGSTAFGAYAAADADSSVALGRYSHADREKLMGTATVGADPLGVGATAGSLTWQSNAGAVSVGSAATRNQAGFDVPATTRQIINVAAGSQDTDAVNVAQLKAAGFKLTTSASAGEVSGTTEEKVQNGETVTIDAGKNIKITQDVNKITVATKDDVEFNTANIGGVNITNNGIDMGGKTITNLASGGTTLTNAANIGDVQKATATAKTEVTGTGLANVTKTQGANGQDIYNVDVATAASPTVTRGNVTVNPADAGKVMTAGDVAKAINDSEKTSSVVAGSTAVSVVAGAEDANGNTQYTVDLSNDTKAQLAKEESVSAGNSNITVDQDVTNATGGKNYKVTLSNNLDLGNAGSVKMGDTTVNNNGMTINGGPSVTKNGIDAGGNKITNVADGDISATSKEAVNGSQLQNVINNFTNNVAAAKTVVTSDNKTVTVVESKNASGASVFDLSVNVGNTLNIDPTSGVINVNTTPLTNNANGTINTPVNPNAFATAGDIVNAVNNAGFNIQANGGATELIKTGETVNFVQGNNMVVTRTGKDVIVATADNVNFTSVTTGNTVINNNGVTITPTATGGNPVTLTENGLNNGGNAITNVQSNLPTTTSTTRNQTAPNPAPNNSNAATVGDVLNAGFNVQTNGAHTDFVRPYETLNFTDGKNTKIVSTTDGETTSFRVDVEIPTIRSTTVSAGSGNISVSHSGLGNNNHYVIDLSPSAKGSLAKAETAVQEVVTNNPNLSASKSGNTVTINLSNNPTFESVNIENGPSMSANGINAAGKPIANVADGINPTDAVNVRQLNRVGDDANAGVSSAMAMASLPQVFLPGKSMLTGGIATYNGESAVAVGLSKLSDNGRWVLKVSGSADTQGNAGGAIGAGFHF